MVAQCFHPLALSRHARRRIILTPRQRGYLTISVMILLFVTAALLTLYVERQSERSRLERGEQIGYALSVLGAGFNLFLDTHHVALAQAQPSVPGVTRALQPTAEEIIRLANIRGVSPVPPIVQGASYRFEVSFPAGCTSAQKLTDTACRPVGLAYIDRPLQRAGAVDWVALARAARVMQGRGGYSRSEDRSRFAFPDGPVSTALVTIPNPTGTAGILAWRADTLSLDRERLLVNGGNRMNTTLRLDGAGRHHDIEGAANISASGDIVARGDLRARDDLSVGRDAEIGGVTKVNDLNFSVFRHPATACDHVNSIGLARDGEILYCDRTRRWASTGGQKPHDVSFLEIDAPTGFLQELVRYYYTVGNWVYCRDHVGSTTLWYEKGVWNVSLSGNSGWHQIMCYGRLN